MDHDLVVRAQRGDREAFASLAVPAGDRLHAVAYRILRDADAAEDATQRALLSIWRDLRQLRDPTRFDAWSCRLLVQACQIESPRVRRWTPNLRVLPVDDGPGSAERPGEVVDPIELERCFRLLSFDQRVALVLRHYLRLPVDEIAEVLGLPTWTVRSRLRNAMRRLRMGIDAESRPTVGAGR